MVCNLCQARTNRVWLTSYCELVATSVAIPDSFARSGNKRYKKYGTTEWQLDYVFNPEGYTRYYGPEEHYAFYYIKDHLGNVREVYVNP